MHPKATGFADIVQAIKKEHPGLSPNSCKFIRLVAIEAEKYDFSEQQVTEFALRMGLKMFTRPKNVPASWKMTLCESYYIAQRYTNPDNRFEYIMVIPNYIGSLPSVVHRTPQGYVDPDWFYKIVPELEKIVNDPTLGRPFSERFNMTVNQLFEGKRNGKGMTPEQVKIINLFFGKNVPDLDGICSNCFKVMLPNSGAGERWVHRSNEKCGVRVMAGNPDSKHESQRGPYVSHTEPDRHGQSLYAFWHESQKVAMTGNRKFPDVHIPCNLYDYKTFSIKMPPCTCREIHKEKAP
jgi:hypothetical protein